MPSPFRQSMDAIFLAMGGWFLYCLCDAISKHVGMRYSAFEILAFTSTVGVLMSGSWMLVQYGPTGFITPKWRWFLLRSLTQAISSFCAIKAVTNIPLADFYGVIFLIPMATALLASFVLKEKIGIFRISAIAFGFMGVLIITGPSFHTQNVGYLFALGSVVCATISAIAIRKIGRDPVLARFAFFPFATTMLIYLPLSLINGIHMPENALDLSLLLLFSPLALAGLVLYSVGFSRARQTAIVAPFHYTQMLWGSLLGFFIFDNAPALTTYIGSAIIIAAGIVIIWREHIHHVQIASTAAETPI